MTQIEAPRVSPAAKVVQTVGLTNIEVSYSRPQKKDREIFGSLVPYDQIWRAGANENTVLTTDKPLVFNKDTLKAGEYAIYIVPFETAWDIIFYSTTDNWGTPDEWKDEQIVLNVKQRPVIKKANSQEAFLISFENLSTQSASINFRWDKVLVELPFKTLTDQEVTAQIGKTMAGPSANDYFQAAAYYQSEKKDLNQALEWMNTGIKMLGDETPFWIIRRKAVIQAEMKNYKAAISTMEGAIAVAGASGYEPYVGEMEKVIEEWKSKK